MPVKCVDCGFLALRNRSTRELVEVESEIRATGKIPHEHIQKEPAPFVYDTGLICFAHAANLANEQNELSTSTGPHERFLAVIGKPRECPRFVERVQGVSPKEHWEMVQETERLKYQAARDAADRTEREKRDKDARDFQRDQATLARRHQNRTLAVSIAAVAVAVIGLIANALIGPSKKPQPINVTVQPSAQQVQETPPLPKKSNCTTTHSLAQLVHRIIHGMIW